MTRVAIVADSPVLRAGLETLVRADSEVLVVGALAGSGGDDSVASIRGLVAHLEPDVVVWMSAPIAGAGAMERDAAAVAADDVPDSGDDEGAGVRGDAMDADIAQPAIVMLTERRRGRGVARALRAGVGAVLPCDAAGDEVVAAVQAVAAGLVVLSREAALELLTTTIGDAEVRPSRIRQQAASLTPREREVLALLAQGLANKAIAPRLGITEHTVKAHVAALYEKLHAGNRAEAVVAAARQGLVLL